VFCSLDTLTLLTRPLRYGRYYLGIYTRESPMRTYKYCRYIMFLGSLHVGYSDFVLLWEYDVNFFIGFREGDFTMCPRGNSECTGVYTMHDASRRLDGSLLLRKMSGSIEQDVQPSGQTVTSLCDLGLDDWDRITIISRRAQVLTSGVSENRGAVESVAILSPHQGALEGGYGSGLQQAGNIIRNTSP